MRTTSLVRKIDRNAMCSPYLLNSVRGSSVEGGSEAKGGESAEQDEGVRNLHREDKHNGREAL